MTLDERLDAYPLLPPNERAAVDREAAGDLEWAARLAEAQSLAATLDVAARGPVTAVDVARRETDRLLGYVTPDANRIDAAVAADAALADEAERVRTRLAVLASTAEPAADQLARLLATVPTAAPSAPQLSSDPSPAARPSADRAPAAPPRARRLTGLRQFLVAASVCVVAYTTAYASSAMLRPERDRVADLRELSYALPTTRGNSGDAQAMRLRDALGAVAEARQTTLGLFPRYDLDALATAADDLAAVAASAEPASAAAQEARFALGRVRLQQGRDDDAARLLGTLVREGSYRAPEARRLLDWIRTQS